ncbi:MAG: tetratricopeptide repeat protein, partial [Hyphomicrobium sp.]|nr:tetratricopeptide repeat protein [Hyphomicrobium sp.]
NLLLYALYSVRAGRPGPAREAIGQAVALDPLNPRTHRAAGIIGYATRDYAGAEAHFNRALELNPAISNARAFLANCLIETGKLDEARVVIANEPSAMFRLTGQAILEHRAGNRVEAQRAFDSLVKEVGDAALYQQAEVMAQWARPDEALALLEKARVVGDSGLISVASDPLLDPISRDARFGSFVRRLGFA